MSRLARITITVPADLLEAAEQRLGAGDPSRSALIRRIIETALREADQREKVKQWINEYRDHPQEEDEVAWGDALAIDALKETPWDASR
jgi:metal-responsive CopG/Arc/MetJ family transcriptional regulator